MYAIEPWYRNAGYPDISQSSHQFSRVAGPQKLGSDCRICVGIMSTSCYIHYSTSTSVSEATFNSRLTLTSDRDFTCPVVLLEHGNMGLAFGITLLTYMKAEKYVSVFVLPVSGDHL